MKKCLIIGAGEFFENSLSPCKGDFVIAADGGYKHLKLSGINPDLIMGDFDSAEKPDFENIEVFPKEKDDTDTMLAVKQGISQGYKEFHIYGGWGDADHTIANVQTLLYISDLGGRGYLYGKGCVLTVISDKITFDKDQRGRISVFSMTDKSEGVTISGLKYNIENASLKSSFPLGVSNEFTGSEAVISVKSGKLLIVYDRKE